jgi:Leucine-rich repeat (LRR) protein
MSNKKQIPEGFAILGILIVVAIIGVFIAGGYLLSTSNGSLSLDTSLQALRQAQELAGSPEQQAGEYNDASGQRLDLSNRGFTTVPKYVFEMTDLVELDLSGNKLTGALPGEIRHLQKLRVLNVGNNQMTGIPAEIGQLTNLEELDYSNNDITGMPYEMANLKELRILNLTGNKYSKYDMSIIMEELPKLTVLE